MNSKLYTITNALIGFLAVLACFSVIPGSVDAEGTGVRLNLREQYGIPRHGAPVTSGVPLPDGAVLSLDRLKLYEIAGDKRIEVPAQFRVLSRWNGITSDASKYIKWVLLDFQANIEAGKNAVYELSWDITNSETNEVAPPDTIQLKENSDSIIVDTGVSRFIIGKADNNNFFNSVMINGQEFIKPVQETGSIIKDSFGEHYFGRRKIREIRVEEAGPLRTVVLMKGSHANESGTDESFYGYTTRFYFYAGKSFVKIQHVLTNTPDLTRERPGRGALAFEDFSHIAHFNLDPGQKQYLIYGENINEGILNDKHSASIYQGSDGSDFWDSGTNDVYSNTRIKGFKITANGEDIATGDRGLGLIAISDANKGVTVAVDQFWQRFPKKLTIDADGRLTVGILPGDFTRPEVNYHWVEDMSEICTEMIYHFQMGPPSIDTVLDRIHPLFAAASPEWYSRSRASSLPGGDIYYRDNGFVPRVLPGYGMDWKYVTVDQIQYPLINPMSSKYDYRKTQGFYSAYYYGPRGTADINGYGFEGPVEHFIHFMQTGLPGNSGDKYALHTTDDRKDFLNYDYDLLWGGKDFVYHWMYNRATNLPDGWQREDYGINTRTDQVEYFFSSNYPKFGGRVGNDPKHTIPELKPTLYSKGRTQPTRDWFFMDQYHVVLNHIVDYYHLFGDMAVLEYAESAGELLENYLPEDIREDGVLDAPPASGEALRGEAWPVLGLLHMYELTEDAQYLSYAKEGAKRIMSEQDLEKGCHITDQAMSLAQNGKPVLAFAKLYEFTGDDIYLDRINGYMNYLVYYVAGENGYLSGYYSLDNQGNKMSYSEAIEYYDSSHHQPDIAPDGMGSSSQRLYFPLAWLYRYTGDMRYRNILDINYDSVTKGNPGWMSTSPWMQTYLSDRFNNPRSDTTPPSAVTDLRIEATAESGKVNLYWTAPDDDSGISKYQLKYAETPMKEQIVLPDESGEKTNFWAAYNALAEPAPSSPGSTQSMTVKNLQIGKTYYFAIRSYDTSQNRSIISNQPSITIQEGQISAPDSPKGFRIKTD